MLFSNIIGKSEIRKMNLNVQWAVLTALDNQVKLHHRVKLLIRRQEFEVLPMVLRDKAYTLRVEIIIAAYTREFCCETEIQ